MTDKEKIIEIFHTKVKGKQADVEGYNAKHDGRKGHWLEKQFGVTPNADNKPDLYGYELKNETTSKTSFGDWSANEYVFNNRDFSPLFQGDKKHEKQDSFVRMFGKSNEKKGGRCSWSGSSCPKIDSYNDCGQILKIDKNRDIIVLYSYQLDKRPDKTHLIPDSMKHKNLEIARWYGASVPSTVKKTKCLKDKLEDKFNDNGWFTCKTDVDGTYELLCFGNPINYDKWIELVAKGIVFFDSGMYEGNKRPYSLWRANNKFWDSLIYEIYK